MKITVYIIYVIIMILALLGSSLTNVFFAICLFEIIFWLSGINIVWSFAKNRKIINYW